MDLLRLKCPVCHSSAIHYHSPYTTKNHGGRVMYKLKIDTLYREDIYSQQVMGFSRITFEQQNTPQMGEYINQFILY